MSAGISLNNNQITKCSPTGAREESSSDGIVKSPVNDPIKGIGALGKAQEVCEGYGEDCKEPVEAICESDQDQKEQECFNNKNNLSTVKFSEEIKIDFIPHIDFRIMCRFMGATSVGDIKNHPYSSPPLITLLLMDSLIGYMETKNYSFAGELNFDDQGNSIPVVKNPWIVRNKEKAFTITGYLYFELYTGKREDNIVFFLWSKLGQGHASITCYSRSSIKSKNIIRDLQKYSKKNNCLRGVKLKDINLFSASFSEVENDPKYNWDNYYYPQNIIDLFKLEVFEFVKNVKKYNECGITKRGILNYSRPGTGKTLLNKIICNMIPDHTAIWITPEIIAENSNQAYNSIKSLYKLADFVSPCVVILEDLDLFGGDRDKGGDLLALGALMNVLDGINTIEGAVTIATTNRLKSIEKAIKNRPGRFDRIVEIPSLSDELRKKMFKDRLKEWKVGKGSIEYLVSNTEKWSGAECQEFINSLNLKYIGSKRKKKSLDRKWIDEIIETMNKFGIGEKSSVFGFVSKDED